MQLIKLQRGISSVTVVLALAGCGGGESAMGHGAQVSVPDPEAAVQADLTVGGSFEGEAVSLPPLTPSVREPIEYRDQETNGLTAVDVAPVPDFDLAKFAVAYDKALAQRSDLSPASDEFARLIIAELSAPRSENSWSIDAAKYKSAGADELAAMLNASEKFLALTNPRKARHTWDAREQVLQVVAANFPGSDYKTRADAFRHAYWNWLMSASCGVEWATAFATAHESGEEETNDKRMDLSNNMIGRRVFRASPDATPAQAQEALLDYKVLYVHEQKGRVTVGVDYLVYLQPVQKISVFDDGPEFDDVYTVSVSGQSLGQTPIGSSRSFEFHQIPSAEHPLDVVCDLDGTKGGCGFQVLLDGASTLPDGTSSTAKILLSQGDTFSSRFTFPNMRASRVR
jgi:hypothetical protein